MSFGDPATTPPVDPATPPVTPPATTPPVETGLPADVQKKIENQDAFIETLKKEAKERDEQIIALLQKKADKSESDESTTELLSLLEKFKTPDTPAPETPPVKEVSMDEIVEAATNKIKQDALDAKRNTNMVAAQELAEKAYGETYEAKIVEIATSKSMTLDAVNDMARNYPTAFAELFLPAATPAKPDLSGGVGGDAGMAPAGDPAPTSFLKLKASDRGNRVQQLMQAKLAELEK